jgi:hypothetical protein
MLREGFCGTRVEERRPSATRRAIDGLVLDDVEILAVVAPADEDVAAWFDDGDAGEVWVCRAIDGAHVVLARVDADRARLLSSACRGAVGGRG